MSRRLLVAGIAVVALLLVLPGASLLYESTAGESCARCHEIRSTFDTWRVSSHRNIACKECHGGALTLDVDFHLTNLRRLVDHLRGRIAEQIRLRPIDVENMMEQCRRCHQQEFAQWQSGPHSATYTKIFLDASHNKKRLLMDDCLRCHGMYFEGAIGDLVTPVSTNGPWKLRDPALANKPAIPCLACHAMHREGAPLGPPRDPKVTASTGQEIVRPSLTLFDRRSMEYLALDGLPLPAVREATRPVKLSPDRRQALCYQCHAPWTAMQVNSGDDRTPIGVHEGLSCMACHQKHSQLTRATCANCHPRLSNCGIDVEKMDTTFKDPKSKHNIHFVKCADCHPKGIPPKRRQSGVVAAGL